MWNDRNCVLLLVGTLLFARFSLADTLTKTDGYKLYRQHCGQCHGRQLTFLQDITRLQFSNALTSGKGAMPPMGRGLGDKEREQIWAFIQSEQKAKEQ